MVWCGVARFYVVGWDGMEWNGMEWNGMEWNGMERNGMGAVLCCHVILSYSASCRLCHDLH